MPNNKNNTADTGETEKEHWMNSRWRPMMGWMYMGVCLFDFIVAPILWSLIQTIGHGSVQTQWQPLTLQGAGLFHVAMGAVLGITAFGRTQEKLNGANNGGLMPSPISPNMGTTYVPPGQGEVLVSNQPIVPNRTMTQNNVQIGAAPTTVINNVSGGTTPLRKMSVPILSQPEI